MSRTTDYDVIRRPLVELEEDSLDELKAKRSSASSPNIDDTDVADGFELPDGDLGDEELVVNVVPIRPDEFRCARCFLVYHRNQFAAQDNGEDICVECS